MHHLLFTSGDLLTRKYNVLFQNGNAVDNFRYIPKETPRNVKSTVQINLIFICEFIINLAGL